MKLCECGCGKSAPIAQRNRTKGNWIKGQSLRFIHGHNGRGKGKPIKKGLPYTINIITGCWIWKWYKDKKGYGVMRKNGLLLKAHRYFYKKYKGGILEGLQLDHLCRNKSCVNPEHLEIVTNAENCRRGLNAKLNYNIILQIKNKLSNGVKQQRLVEQFNVSPSTISEIARGKAWI
mgnify:CR=1 FL=1